MSKEFQLQKLQEKLYVHFEGIRNFRFDSYYINLFAKFDDFS